MAPNDEDFRPEAHTREPTAIPIEKLERGFEATRDYLKDGGSTLIRVMNQPLPIRVSSPGLEEQAWR